VIATPISVTSNAPATLPPPSWLMPLLVISGIAILLIIGWVLVSAFAGRREVTARTFKAASKSDGGSHPHGEDNENNSDK
jgi:hypothetical protein